MSSSTKWRKGWPLRSGDFANLCDKCGSAYERKVFCDLFHQNDTGWRECTYCGKRLHCGCIASSALVEMMDCGGVKCIGCGKSLALQPALKVEKSKGLGILPEISNAERGLVYTSNNGKSNKADKMSVERMNNVEERCDLKGILSRREDEAAGDQIKDEITLAPPRESGTMSSSNLNIGTSEENTYKAMGIKNVYESLSLAQTNLTIAPLASPSGSQNPYPCSAVEDLSRAFLSFQQMSKSRHLLPRPPKSIEMGETNAGLVPQIRVARPPAEGRVKNQLLPRYWPRITDQELRQISGDSNSTIVPLFEKVLSASDAGRIGRLVLPKACAEAYFPPISQPEGLPLRIQDVKGKEWAFQFRFWPNNNSRMYVLEGVTPCIQSMQLQAGDTVTFSRMDPEGKLLMGFRKASNSMTTQNLPIMSGYSGLLKGSADPNPTIALRSYSGDMSLQIMEKNGSDTRDVFVPNSATLELERKRSRNLGLKSKRLLIDSREALELKLTWEETQDMLRPPSNEKPSVVSLEDLEIEEYEEPPVFGKKSIFTARSSGIQEQWTPCDICSKWRKLPIDILLPPTWTCMDNVWDQSRSSCSAPDEMSPKDLETLLRLSKDFKKQRTLANHSSLAEEHESARLNTLGNSPAIGDGLSDLGGTVATTTKHPRHRPGCSCIVCIQPPSGKGKHKPTCTCNVCMTVKRRFKTLMMRKKKRQSEKEAEIAHRSQNFWGIKDESEVDSTIKECDMDKTNIPATKLAELPEIGKGKWDLNSNPDRKEMMSHQVSSHVSMTSLVQVATLPLENYLKQNGLTSLVSEQQGSSGSHSQPQATGEEEVKDDDDQTSNDA